MRFPIALSKDGVLYAVCRDPVELEAAEEAASGPCICCRPTLTHREAFRSEVRDAFGPITEAAMWLERLYRADAGGELPTSFDDALLDLFHAVGCRSDSREPV